MHECGAQVVRVDFFTNIVLWWCMAKQEDFVRYTVRVPQELYAKLQASAGARSVNAEIVERLARSFELDDEIQGLQSSLAEMREELDSLSRDTDKRLDRVESRVWELLERAGVYDPNPD